MSQSPEKDPPIVRTMNTFGANLKEGGRDWIGTCLFCGKEKKLFVNPEKEMWDCKVCGASGNRISLLQQVYDRTRSDATDDEYEELATHRSIPSKHLRDHGFAIIDGIWLIPGRTSKGKIHDLRRYDLSTKQLASTAGCESQLWGAEKLAIAPRGSRVWLCEGEWDGMAMRWMLNVLQMFEDVVVAVPGASILKKEWVPLFDGMHVMACYDADDAGKQGARRALKMLKESSASMKFLCWPETRPSGYDIRDHVTAGMEAAGAKPTLSSLMGLMSSNLPGQVETEGAAGEERVTQETELEPIELEGVLAEFRAKIRMSAEMEQALVVALAVAVSNDMSGDPLWCYLIGPPGAGKTLLLSAFANSKRCIFRSTVTPASLVSGWKESKSDPSLIPQLKGKTFVAKDFTEVLSMPMVAQEEVFSTLRGAYDGSVQKTFGNGITREYKDCHFSMLAGVTNAIHGHRGASLGERFLKFQLTKLEGDDADSVIASAIKSVGIEKQREEALQLVVNRFLARKMDLATLPEMSDKYAIRLTALVQLVAILRAQVDRDRYRDDVLYRPMPESGTRLAKQLAKMAICLSFVLGKSEVDDVTYSIVEKLAYDTAYGFSLDIVDALMSLGGEATRQAICEKADLPLSTVCRKMEDLGTLKAVRAWGKKITDIGGRPSMVYKVENDVKQLWLRAKDEQCLTPPSTKPRAKLTIKSGSPAPATTTTSSQAASAPSKPRLVLRRPSA